MPVSPPPPSVTSHASNTQCKDGTLALLGTAPLLSPVAVHTTVSSPITCRRHSAPQQDTQHPPSTKHEPPICNPLFIGRSTPRRHPYVVFKVGFRQEADVPEPLIAVARDVRAVYLCRDIDTARLQRGRAVILSHVGPVITRLCPGVNSGERSAGDPGYACRLSLRCTPSGEKVMIHGDEVLLHASSHSF